MLGLGYKPTKLVILSFHKKSDNINLFYYFRGQMLLALQAVVREKNAEAVGIRALLLYLAEALGQKAR